MNLKQLAKGILVFIAVFIVGVVLHTCIFSRIVIGVVTPNILLLLTSAFGFMIGGTWGMAFGFISGIVIDCQNPVFFGLNCLIYLIIGYLNGLMTKFFYGDDLRLPMLLVGVSDVIFGAIYYLFFLIIGRDVDFNFYFMNIIMPEAVYTVLVFALFYYLLIHVAEWIKGNGTRNYLY